MSALPSSVWTLRGQDSFLHVYISTASITALHIMRAHKYLNWIGQMCSFSGCWLTAGWGFLFSQTLPEPGDLVDCRRSDCFHSSDAPTLAKEAPSGTQWANRHSSLVFSGVGPEVCSSDFPPLRSQPAAMAPWAAGTDWLFVWNSPLAINISLTHNFH